MTVLESASPHSVTNKVIDDILAVLTRLVGFDTTSARSNLALIDYVEDYLASYGIATHRIANGDGSKANLLATLGDGQDGGIVLSGHTDVVPVLDQPWTSDPFVLTRRGDRLYGRGTSDMKSFLAMALAAVPHLSGRRLRCPIHLAFSYDEEVGCLGAPDMIRRMLADGYRPMAAIIGEPTNMQIVHSHKSNTIYEVVVTGREAHSSLVDEGISANMVAIGLLGELARIAAEERDGHRHDGFDPAWSTLTVGTIQGGTAANILARECRFTFDLRGVPGREADVVLAPFWMAVAEAEAQLAAKSEGTGITVTRVAEVPGLRREQPSAAEEVAAMLSGANRPGSAVAYGTEAGQFQEAGVSSVICGPGSISQAHKPDEYIEVSQIEAGARFITRLIDFARAG